MIDKKIITGVVASVGASLCCITPILALVSGSSTLASSFTWLEPFRPYLILLTVVVLAYAWWDKLRVKSQDIECKCESDVEKVSFWHSKLFLALVTLFSIIMLAFPYYNAVFEDDKPKIIYVD
ncbi:hypothetical protein JHD46_03355 [Sulfurimonas sp. SAG-AH-194-C20]|nr:mercuric transporter MerT family protein [Sulfurimonas sp. SAG-AH-194-C20]MDF1878672.1 hypothetical protein [Sulfurimonas sp. SAG-AH-194-C20]